MFLGIVQGLRMSHTSHVFLCYEIRRIVHTLQLERNIYNQKKKIKNMLPSERQPLAQQRAPLTPHRREAESQFQVCFIVSSSGLIYSSLQVWFISAVKMHSWPQRSVSLFMQHWGLFRQMHLSVSLSLSHTHKPRHSLICTASLICGEFKSPRTVEH